jgi:dolichyl-phosphate-mannose-protein mannosyltransferase
MRRDGTRLALVFASFVTLTAVLTYPQVVRIGTAISDPGDPLLNLWAIAWIAHQVPIDPAHVFDANIFYPERRTLAFSESLLIPGLMTAPLFWAGVNPVLSYNLLFLSGFVLSGVGTYVLVRRLTGRNDAAMIAGLCFAFQPYRLDHYPHLQMQMTQFMPLALWALHRLLEGQRLRHGALVGVFVACNALSSVYYGVFFTTFIALVGALLVALCGRRRPLRTLAALALGAAIAVVMALPAARAYAINRRLVGERSLDEARAGSAEPRNYLSTSDRSLLYAWTPARFGKDESRLFPGWTPIVLSAVAIVPPLRPATIAYLAGGAFAFDASLGWNGWSYPILYRAVGPFRALRVPARIGIIVGLSLSVLAGIGFARIVRRIARPGMRLALALLVGGIAALEYSPGGHMPLFEVWKTVPGVYDSITLVPEGGVLELPLGGHDPAYMYFSTTHWKPLLNGYSGFFPPSYKQLHDRIETFPDADSVAYLQGRRVRYIVLHEAFFGHGEYPDLVARMEHVRELKLVSSSKWNGHDVRLYRLAVP